MMWGKILATFLPEKYHVLPSKWPTEQSPQIDGDFREYLTRTIGRNVLGALLVTLMMLIIVYGVVIKPIRFGYGLHDWAL